MVSSNQTISVAPSHLILLFFSLVGSGCLVYLLYPSSLLPSRQSFAESSTVSPAIATVPFLRMLHLPKWYNKEVWSKAKYIDGVDDSKTYDERRKELNSTNEDLEDKTLMMHFFNGVRNGLILEFGATDGLWLSASKPLEMFFDWRSILLEANTDFAAKLAANRPNALSFNAAVCKEKRTLHFRPLQGNGVILEVASLHFLQKLHDDVLNESKSALDPTKLKKEWEVECIPLGPVLEGLGVKHLDVAIFDCEGCELEALQSVDFNKIDVDVLVVETNRVSDQANTREVIDHMKKYPQYEVAIRTLGRNTWFTRKGFVRRHSGAAATLPQ